jgi:hypothetical protein
MKRTTFSAVAGEFNSADGPGEVWAVAETSFDEARSRLTILFSSSMRLTEGEREDELLTASWLPEREVVQKFIPADRTVSYANDFFHAWIAKVRESIPTNISTLAVLHSTGRS